ncbi:MAG TPA: hypothetical protein VGI39_30345 [Polyangiaceae bacterium]|jgi:hypothetical protein
MAPRMRFSTAEVSIALALARVAWELVKEAILFHRQGEAAAVEGSDWG